MHVTAEPGQFECPPDDNPLRVAPGKDQPIDEIEGRRAVIPLWVLQVVDEDGRGMSGADLRVYIALRGFTDKVGHSFPHVSTLAREAGVTKRSAERAVAWLRKVGLVTTKRNYRDDGSIYGCEYWLRNTSPSEGGTDSTVGGVPTASPGGYRPDCRSNNRPREQTNSTDHRSDQSSTAFGGGATIPNQRTPWTDLDNDSTGFDEMTNEQPPNATEKLTEARVGDRKLFREVVGDKLRTDGSRFGPEGVYDADQFYTAFRKAKRKRPITWPGRMIQAIAEASPYGTADDYLISLGLEPV